MVVESARPVQMASLYLDANGLTPAQSRVAALVLQGRSTRQIVNELRISPYTVQERLVEPDYDDAAFAEAVASMPDWDEYEDEP